MIYEKLIVYVFKYFVIDTNCGNMQLWGSIHVQKCTKADRENQSMFRNVQTAINQSMFRNVQKPIVRINPFFRNVQKPIVRIDPCSEMHKSRSWGSIHVQKCTKGDRKDQSIFRNVQEPISRIDPFSEMYKSLSWGRHNFRNVQKPVVRINTFSEAYKSRSGGSSNVHILTP